MYQMIFNFYFLYNRLYHSWLMDDDQELIPRTRQYFKQILNYDRTNDDLFNGLVTHRCS